MKRIVRKLVIGASIAVGVSAIASKPASGATLSNIQFNTHNYKTFIGADITTGNSAKAIQALTDNDPVTNVELWASTEAPTANVGFTANLGNSKVSVSSVTAADWAVFGQDWLNKLIASNSSIATVWQTLSFEQKRSATDILKTNGLPSSGDPNIGAFTLDDATGEYKLDLIGHLNLKPRILAGQYNTGSIIGDKIFTILTTLETEGSIQASEIAKVTIDDKVYYAYDFFATSTGSVAVDDRESHTGKYTWKLSRTPSIKSTPEPSIILGMLVVGSMFAIQRGLKKAQKASG